MAFLSDIVQNSHLNVFTFIDPAHIKLSYVNLTLLKTIDRSAHSLKARKHSLEETYTQAPYALVHQYRMSTEANSLDIVSLHYMLY